jgi:adenine-specific DNA-methyltransferase
MSYRYIGNKSRLLTHIMPRIRSKVKKGARVADLMCGTASVAESLRVSGYQVIASDVMTYSVFHAHVRLMLDTAPRFVDLGIGSYHDVLCALQHLPPEQGYFYNEFSPEGNPKDTPNPRMYFTAENAGRLDAILHCLARWENAMLLSSSEKALLRHDLVLATNRIANIAGTYGHYRSSWSNSALSPIILKSSQFIPNFRTDHTILQGYAEVLASSITADLCYLDPPYIKRQYAANYHILETIARGDQPNAVGVSGLRPWRDQYSDFCSKIKIRSAFTSIIENMNCPQFLISYSEDGLLSLEDLRDLLSQFGTVQLEEFEYPRFRSNDSNLSTTLREYLFHLEKK